MSLINKMLQDLEQRSDTSNSSSPLSGEVHAVSAPAKSSPVKLIGVLVVGAICLLAVWLVLRPKTVEAPAAVLASAPAPAPAPAPIQPSAPAPAPAVAAVTAAAPIAATTAPQQERPVAAPVAAVAPAPAPVIGAAPAKPVAQKTAEPKAPVLAKAEVGANIKEVPAEKAARKSAKPDAANTKPAKQEVAAAETPNPEGKVVKQFNPQQQSDNLYKQAIAQVQHGMDKDAQLSLRLSLKANPGNDKARLMLAGLLTSGNTLPEAAALLREGLKLSPSETAYSMALARLQIESGDANGAVNTLTQGMPGAGDDPQYHAFYALLMQRARQHDEAVKHYLVALRGDPAMPAWLVGIGISLQAQGKNADAAEAFQRAKDGGMLSQQLVEFIDQRLSQLK